MKIRTSIIINSNIIQVFDLFTDLDKIKDIVPGIVDIRVLEGSHKMELGTKWTETRVILGKEASETMTITKIEQNKSYTSAAKNQGMEYTSTYEFIDKKGTTEVSMEFVGKPVSILAKLFTPIAFMFKNSTKKTFDSDMQSIKFYAENKQ